MYVVFYSQGLRLMTTSPRGPRLGSWPLPADAPVGSGNLRSRIFNRPSLYVLYVSEQPGKLHWFLNTGLKLRRENKLIKHVSVIGDDLTDDQWFAKVTFTRSNLCLNWSDWPDYLHDEWRATYEFKCFSKFKLIILTLTKSAHYHPASCEESQTKQTVKDQNQYSFWWFKLEWCRLNYLKIVKLDSVKYLFPPSHTNMQYTVDTIALDSYEDVCGFCLWFKPTVLSFLQHRGSL